MKSYEFDMGGRKKESLEWIHRSSVARIELVHAFQK